MQRTKLAQGIARDLTEPPEPGEVETVLDLLDRYTVPSSPTNAAQLIERLRPFTPVPARRRFRTDGLAASPALALLGYLLAQMHLFRPAWWMGTTAATALGLALTARLGLAPGLLAPPLVAVSMAYSFREVGTPAMEMELSCPVHPAQVVLARALVVLGWVTVLGAAAGAVLGQVGGPFGFWPALAGWLAGMLLFGGLALVAVLWTGRGVGVTLALVGWLFFLIWHLQSGSAGLLWGFGNALAAALGAALIAAAVLGAPHLKRLHRWEG